MRRTGPFSDFFEARQHRGQQLDSHPLFQVHLLTCSTRFLSKTTGILIPWEAEVPLADARTDVATEGRRSPDNPYRSLWWFAPTIERFLH